MTFCWGRVGAILHKELRDYRRNRLVIVTMTVLPLLFIVLPMIQIFNIPAAVSSTKLDNRIGLSLLYMLLIPTFVPSTLSAYSVVGEREQGTLEPILTTPIRREEFLVGKALAILGPTLVVGYAIFGIYLAAAALFAEPGVVSAVFHGSHLLVQLLFIPLLAAWSVWVGITISMRSTDVRAAQQLSILTSLPPLVVVALLNFGVIPLNVGVTLGLAAVLLIVDGLGWRIVARLFNRERLIAGSSG